MQLARFGEKIKPYRKVPECQAVGPKQNADGCGDEDADPLRDNHDAHAAHAIGQWPGDESGEQQRDGAVRHAFHFVHWSNGSWG